MLKVMVENSSVLPPLQGDLELDIYFVTSFIQIHNLQQVYGYIKSDKKGVTFPRAQSEGRNFPVVAFLCHQQLAVSLI